MSRVVLPQVSSALGKLAKKHAHFSQRVEDICCPKCGKSYEIVPSRRELVEPVGKLFFSFYRCRVCEGRFSIPRYWLRCTATIGGAAVCASALWVALRFLI
jgi:hypothetical protein